MPYERITEERATPPADISQLPREKDSLLRGLCNGRERGFSGTSEDQAARCLNLFGCTTVPKLRSATANYNGPPEEERHFKQFNSFPIVYGPSTRRNGQYIHFDSRARHDSRSFYGGAGQPDRQRIASE